MKYLLTLIFIFTFENLSAVEIKIESTAKKLQLYAGTKATIQWERVFSSQRRMKKYKINTLSNKNIDKLKTYLIEHSADSKQPIVPGL